MSKNFVNDFSAFKNGRFIQSLDQLDDNIVKKNLLEVDKSIPSVTIHQSFFYLFHWQTS